MGTRRPHVCPLRPTAGEPGRRGPAGQEEGRRPGLTCPAPPGPSLSCFHWPRGVQACARLQQLLDWTRSAGCGGAGERFFRKLSCTLHLLATPRAQLIQVGGRGSGGGGGGPMPLLLGRRPASQAGAADSAQRQGSGPTVRPVPAPPLRPRWGGGSAEAEGEGPETGGSPWVPRGPLGTGVLQSGRGRQRRGSETVRGNRAAAAVAGSGWRERPRARTSRNREWPAWKRGPQPPTCTELNPDDQMHREPGPALQPPEGPGAAGTRLQPSAHGPDVQARDREGASAAPGYSRPRSLTHRLPPCPAPATDTVVMGSVEPATVLPTCLPQTRT